VGLAKGHLRPCDVYSMSSWIFNILSVRVFRMACMTALVTRLCCEEAAAVEESGSFSLGLCSYMVCVSAAAGFREMFGESVARTVVCTS
jgi:hypothetical protein